MKKLTACFLSLVLFSLTACSINYREVIEQPERLFYQGNYLEGARLLLPYVNKSDKNQLLFLLEAGYMLHAGKDYEKSTDVFLNAASIAPVVPVSVTEQAASYLTDERRTSYKGEDFEKVLIHMYLGINFLMLKKYDKARTAFQNVNQELSRIKSEDGNAKYKQNMMAQYLAAIAYEIKGDTEDNVYDLRSALNQYKLVLQLRPDFDQVKMDLQRVALKLKDDDEYKQLVAKLGRRPVPPPDAGEVIAIHEAGLAPIKVSRGKLLADRSMNVFIIGYMNKPGVLAAGLTAAAVLKTLETSENPIPVYKTRSSRVAQMRVSVGGLSSFTMPLEDIETTAIRTFNDDYERLKTKVATSIVVKAITAAGAGIAARQLAKSSKKTSGYADLIGIVVGVGTGAVLFSATRPDLRCWHTLPANMQLTRIFLRPGKYKLRADFLNRGRAVVSSKEMDIEVKKGERVFINERTL